MTTEKQTTTKSRWWAFLVVAAFIAGMVVLLVQNLPRGFDMDLDKIGTGKSAVVFVYDNNLSVSGLQTAEMDKIRDRFDERVHFLVADIGRPQASQWMAHHQARAADLFFFSEQGELRHRQSALLTADELAATIAAVLPSAE